jgi:hypothetical protein
MGTFEEVKSKYYKILTRSEFKIHSDKKEAHVILVDGKRIITRSGKSEWPSIRAAKSALRYHLNSIQYKNKKEAGTVSDAEFTGSFLLTSKAIKEAENEWIANHVVFLPLRLYHPPVTKNRNPNME